MQFVAVFGVSYYYDLESVQPYVRHAMRLITDRWGNDLDNGSVPAFVRHKANLLLVKWGALDA
jgi:hypothetical protein